MTAPISLYHIGTEIKLNYNAAKVSQPVQKALLENILALFYTSFEKSQKEISGCE